MSNQKKKPKVLIEIDLVKISHEVLKRKAADNSIDPVAFGKAIEQHESIIKAVKK